jgi:hypothetical protein
MKDEKAARNSWITHAGLRMLDYACWITHAGLRMLDYA